MCVPLVAVGWIARARPSASNKQAREEGAACKLPMVPLSEEEELAQLRALIGDSNLERLRPTGNTGIMPPGVAQESGHASSNGKGQQQQQQKQKRSSRSPRKQPWFAQDYSREAIIKEYRQEANWNSSVHRSTPSTLRGIKPLPGTTLEPWAQDAVIYASKDGMDEMGGVAIFDPEQAHAIGDLVAQARAAKKKHALSSAAGSSTAKVFQGPGWNSTTQRTVPYALRGIQPVTNEPWSNDAFKTTKTDRDTEAAGKSGGASRKRASKKKLSVSAVKGHRSWLGQHHDAPVFFG